jgi:hypothetical protein
MTARVDRCSKIQACEGRRILINELALGNNSGKSRDNLHQNFSQRHKIQLEKITTKQNGDKKMRKSKFLKTLALTALVFVSMFGLAATAVQAAPFISERHLGGSIRE